MFFTFSTKISPPVKKKVAPKTAGKIKPIITTNKYKCTACGK